MPSAIVPRPVLARLHADDAHPGRSARSAIAMPAARPAAADRQEERPDVGQLVGELETDRALARDHRLVLERVHERRTRLGCARASASTSASSKPAPASTVFAP